jgi:hypothetical protein
MPLLSDEIVKFFSEIVVKIPSGNFWVIPLLHAMSDIYIFHLLVKPLSISP